MGLFSRLRQRLSRRALAIISLVGGSLLLAAVIFGVSALSTPEKSSTSSLALTAQEESEEYFDLAVAALASGETTEAADLLRQALAADPDNAAARSELQRIASGTDDTPGSSSGGTPPTGSTPQSPSTSTSGFDKPQSDMGVLLPRSAEGFQLGERVIMTSEAQVPAEPASEQLVGVVRLALFSVHDRETTAAAREFRDDVSRVAYPNDAAAVDINGTEAYFGTDGERFAVVSFSRGRYAFEVILSSETGAPSALRNWAIRAASAFPTSL